MTISKNILSKKRSAALAVSSLSLLAACAGAASFMDRACSTDTQPFTVGVNPDGTALYQGGSENVYQLTWNLEGGKLTLNSPAGSNQSADVNVADLENGTLTHTDTSAEGEGAFIGGEPGTVSNVKWDFEKRTVSFQSQADSVTPGDVVSCNKTSDKVTLIKTPDAEK
jgi:hypothetical protein